MQSKYHVIPGYSWWQSIDKNSIKQDTQ